jgi:phage baseplate assembly protein gpV
MIEFEKLAADVEDLRRRMAGLIRYGVVISVDPAAGKVRLKIGAATEGGDALTASLPYMQTAGAVRGHNPPSVGQQMMILSPSGDMRQGVALPLTWSDAIASPGNSLDDHILTFGSVRVSMKVDRLKFTVGGVSLEVTGDGVAITGGSVTHDGTTIDKTHTHSGIMSGPERTGNPQ